MKKLTIKTHSQNEFIDITHDVRSYISQAGVSSGLCTVFVPHTTAGVTVNENADPNVRKDILKYLSSLIPRKADFSHSEGNSDSHIKSSVIGCEKTFIIEEGQILLGTWQGIYFCEFDGPRTRTLFIKVTGA
ncbi:MAG: YjbQ family protein [Candidatus Aureabacteria bacterium]|nr:YjbQ family protein [Candidatus Auribacterota bacterium]